MNSAFAYSAEMQIILVIVSYINSYLHMYLNANLILKIYGEQVSRKQKVLFAFLAGPILHMSVIYTLYFIGGRVAFTQFQYGLIASINPITALLYCYFGIKVFKLSKDRSIELMGHSFMYSAIIHSMNTCLATMVFVQNDPMHYNYAFDTIRLFVSMGLLLLMFSCTMWLIHRHKQVVVSQAAVIPRPKSEMAVYVFKASFSYLCMVSIPLVVPSYRIATLIILVILVLLFAFTLSQSLYRHAKAEIANKEAHLSSLINSLAEFRGLKHDFYNILQTYSGYLALGDLDACRTYHESLLNITVQTGNLLDLNMRVPENPALMSLILEKHKQAEELGIQMNISITCQISALPIGELDLCRMMSCLLNNALEAALESEQRRISFLVEQKTDHSILMIITNSCQKPLDPDQMFIAGRSSKKGHQGIGLNNVKRMIEKNSNCTFQIRYYNNEMIAYVELRNDLKYKK